MSQVVNIDSTKPRLFQALIKNTLAEVVNIDPFREVVMPTIPVRPHKHVYDRCPRQTAHGRPGSFFRLSARSQSRACTEKFPPSSDCGLEFFPSRPEAPRLNCNFWENYLISNIVNGCCILYRLLDGVVFSNVRFGQYCGRQLISQKS